jgi:DNA-binding transcriptional ArsR family regulator
MLETMTALAEPNRLRIVELLREGGLPVGQIAERLRMRQPQVSKHLSVLRAAGLVEVRPRAQLRMYELRPDGLRILDIWLEPYRRFWDARLDALERRLDSPGEVSPVRKEEDQ